MTTKLSTPTWPVLCALLATGSLAGCVTQGKYDALVAERDELAQQNETLRNRTLELKWQGAEIAHIAFELSEELELRDREVAQLQREQQELAEELATFVVAGLIKMQLLKDGLHLVLSEEILFPTGSSELKPTGRDVLTQLVGELEQVPYQVAVFGHTDNVPVGGRLALRYPSNWDLAGARATSVVRLMEGAGIPSGRLVAVSFGPTRPIASNDTPEGREQNRRIEVRLRPVVP